MERDCLLDLRLLSIGGVELLEKIKKEHPQISVMGHLVAEFRTALEALKTDCGFLNGSSMKGSR